MPHARAPAWPSPCPSRAPRRAPRSRRRALRRARAPPASCRPHPSDRGATAARPSCRLRRPPPAPAAALVVGPADLQPVGNRLGPGGERGHGPFGELPFALAGDADGVDAIPLGVDGLEHVGSGDARDVVLGRLAAEDHEEVDPFVGHADDGSWCLSRDPGTLAPCDSWRATSRRQRAAVWSVPTWRSTPRRSIPAPSGPASCSCRSSPTATATTSSPPHWLPAPAPTSRRSPRVR